MQVAILAARVEEQVGGKNRRNRCAYVTFVYQIEWSCAEHGE